jgi:hypothetical protein
MSIFKDKLIKNREKLRPIKNYINNNYHNLELYNSLKSSCYKSNPFIKHSYNRSENV